jgi:hypothetical protein
MSPWTLCASVADHLILGRRIKMNLQARTTQESVLQQSLVLPQVSEKSFNTHNIIYLHYKRKQHVSIWAT